MLAVETDWLATQLSMRNYKMEENRTEYIKTVKDNHEAYLVNNSMSVPKDESNRHYRDVQQWIDEGGVVEVIPPPDPLVERAEAAEHRIDNQALKLLLLPLVESKPEEEQETFSFLFPAWRPDIDVLVDEKRQHEGLLYKCLQAHRTQSDWLPNNTPALWARVSAPGVIDVWMQPAGGHDAYNTGDKVIWPEGGPIWESTIDANVWEPGVHGWIQVE